MADRYPKPLRQHAASNSGGTVDRPSGPHIKDELKDWSGKRMGAKKKKFRAGGEGGTSQMRTRGNEQKRGSKKEMTVDCIGRRESGVYYSTRIEGPTGKKKSGRNY